MPISEALANRRRRLELSQEAIAKRAGLTQTYLSKIERAKVDPRLSTIQDVARAVGSEIVLVPTESLPALRAVLGQGRSPEDRPLFEVERE
ncbi:MAG: helix-turn-helix domain-containing protein [Candidatus Eremiobacteraeota bacterium]|nr:helix-turn-helix domain-containing protein [Candidatus Eremiobacteraeota bacterium]